MLCEVHGVMLSWVHVKFVCDLASSQNFIERNCSDFKAEVILISAIKINMQAR